MDNKKYPQKKESIFSTALNDVEHALCMYATSYCILSAKSIYEEQILKAFSETIGSSHIYLIGYTPCVRFIDAKQKEQILYLKYLVRGKEYLLRFELPHTAELKQEQDISWVEDANGNRIWPDNEAYGKGGSRNAIDRLLKHETLQKIAIKGAPEGHEISVLLLQIHPSNLVFTVFNPFSKIKEKGDERIKLGLDKLFGTNEQERIALYEASLIKYFEPEFNKEFKNSFPSTSLKILQDCYQKDFSAVVAEICIDNLFFRLYSDKVPVKHHHLAKHDLHEDQERRAFFGL
jgi:hypothetical protein